MALRKTMEAVGRAMIKGGEKLGGESASGAAGGGSSGGRRGGAHEGFGAKVLRTGKTAGIILSTVGTLAFYEAMKNVGNSDGQIGYGGGGQTGYDGAQIPMGPNGPKKVNNGLQVRNFKAPSQHSYQCFQCMRRLTDKQGLQRHLTRVHHNRNRPLVNQIQCFQCLKHFGYRMDLAKHVVRHCTTMATRCLHCSKLIKDMRRHIRTVHSSNTQCRYRCFYCFRLFSNPTNFGHHVQTVHTKEPKTVQCFQCLKVINAGKVVLYNHIACRHSSYATYHCFHCLKIFKLKWILKEHVRKVHSGERSRAIQCFRCLNMLRIVKEHFPAHFRSVNCIKK